MKKFWNKIKPVLLAIFWMACGSGMVVLLGAAIDRQENLKLKSIIVNVDQSNDMLFVNQQDVLQLLKDNRMNVNNTSLAECDPRHLERVIESNPWVETANIFINPSGDMTVQVVQRTPILRVINNQGVSYYIDEHAAKMPLSANFTARVPIATGFIFSNPENENTIDSVTEKKLFVLASFIRSDSFLASLTEQIVVDQQKEFQLIPVLGQQTIMVGDLDSLEQKFNKLKIFYSEGMKKEGWPNYKTINIKFSNEVYCEKRDSNEVKNSLMQSKFSPTDSTEMKQQL